MSETIHEYDRQIMTTALQEARKSFEQGGIPVGAALAIGDKIVARGHNQRVQLENPILHGEMDCLQNYGRQPNYRGITLYTTLNPCMMCAGTIVQFGIKRVVIGQEEVAFPPGRPFKGNIPFLRDHGVDICLLNDPDCEALFDIFLQENQKLWLEDIGDG